MALVVLDDEGPDPVAVGGSPANSGVVAQSSAQVSGYGIRGIRGTPPAIAAATGHGLSPALAVLGPWGRRHDADTISLLARGRHGSARQALCRMLPLELNPGRRVIDPRERTVSHHPWACGRTIQTPAWCCRMTVAWPVPRAVRIDWFEGTRHSPPMECTHVHRDLRQGFLLIERVLCSRSQSRRRAPAC